VKRCMIEKGSHFGVAAFAAENIQLLFGANKVTRKTKKFKKKSAAFGVGRIVTNFCIQSLNGVVKPTCLEKLLN